MHGWFALRILTNMFAAFPLNIVVLPQESVALHLFEPRYKQLFIDYRNGKEFAIIYSDKSGLSSHGSLVRIDKIVNEFPDGTVDIIVKGTSLIKIKKFHKLYPKKTYSAVDAEVLKVVTKVSAKLKALFLTYLLKVGKKTNPKVEFDLYQLANRLEMDQKRKNELIQHEDEIEIHRFLSNEIRFLAKIKEQEELLNRNFHLN